MEIRFGIVVDDINDDLLYRVRRFLSENLPHTDSTVRSSYLGDFRVIACTVYVQRPSWQDIFSAFKNIKNQIEQTGVQIFQVVLAEEMPSYQFRQERNGIWVSAQNAIDNRELRSFLKEIGADFLEQEWFFYPFEQGDSENPDYETCEPDEKLQRFASRINGSIKRNSVPVNLRVRLREGYRLSDYISSAFESTLGSMPNLGGINVLLTTLLQMNDKLDLANYYSEELQHSEEMDLYSLSAMHISMVDPRDDTNIAVLVSSGKLIADVKLGG